MTTQSSTDPVDPPPQVKQTTSDSKPPPDRTWVEFETAFRSKNSKDTEKR